MQIALVGWQSSGKSTLFTALTGDEPAIGEAAHSGISGVPDNRIDNLHKLYPPAKKIYAKMEYIDLAGVAHDDNRSGLKRSMINHLQGANVLALVTGAFLLEGLDEVDIIESITGDIEDFDSELILSDMQTVENRLERLAGNKKRGIKTDPVELKLLEKLRITLESETPLRSIEIESQEAKMIRSFGLLSQKPLMVIINRSELQNDAFFNSSKLTTLENSQRKLVVVDARLDAEIASLDEEDRILFLNELGIDHPAADIVMQTGYSLLGLISFFTVGDDEVRAWSIPSGTPAVEAAGTIHSDLQRGFIRAEVVSSEDLLREGSLSACRDKGLLRLEGKNYIVQDGDVMHVRFAV